MLIVYQGNQLECQLEPYDLVGTFNNLFNVGKLHEEIIGAVIVHAMHRHLTWIDMHEIKPLCDNSTCYAQATDMKPCRIKPPYDYTLRYAQVYM